MKKAGSCPPGAPRLFFTSIPEAVGLSDGARGHQDHAPVCRCANQFHVPWPFPALLRHESELTAQSETGFRTLATTRFFPTCAMFLFVGGRLSSPSPSPPARGPYCCMASCSIDAQPAKALNSHRRAGSLPLGSCLRARPPLLHTGGAF